MLLAFGEAITDAIEHARVSSPRVTITAATLDNQLQVTIADNGHWTPPPRNTGDRGRGITLMRAAMGSVNIDPGPQGTTVHLTKQLHR